MELPFPVFTFICMDSYFYLYGIIFLVSEVVFKHLLRCRSSDDNSLEFFYNEKALIFQGRSKTIIICR